MLRSFGPIAAFVLLGLAACTRPNPAFGDDENADHGESGEGESEAESSQGEVDTSDTGEGPVDTSDEGPIDSSDEGPITDLPDEDPTCAGGLGSPLALRFSRPDNWNLNACPPETTLEGRLELVNGIFVVRACESTEGCSLDCQILHPLDAGGYDFEPMLGQCVLVEAAKPVNLDRDVCSYSSLSVFPTSDLGSPYFVGTAYGAGPTALAADVLAGWPQLHGDQNGPTPEAVCSCGSLGVVSSCCMADVDEVELFSFLLAGGLGIAQVGTLADYELAGAAFEYSFYNAMARRVGTCTQGEIETSWKLFATSGF